MIDFDDDNAVLQVFHPRMGGNSLTDKVFPSGKKALIELGLFGGVAIEKKPQDIACTSH